MDLNHMKVDILSSLRKFPMRCECVCKIFEPFGALELVQLPFDKETGKHHGYGFVQFVRLEDASAALCLDGYKELIFESFGALELVQLPFDKETGKHHGYGFVQFVRLEDASAALCLDGYKELFSIQLFRNSSSAAPTTVRYQEMKVIG